MEPSNKRVVSRRQFMQLSAYATAGVALAACGGGAPAAPAAEAPAAEAPAAAPAAADASSAAAPGQYNEAPMLAELVQAGSLPPVDERLPTTPGVIEVAETTGNYGGTFRRAFSGVSDRVGAWKCQDHSLMWYDHNLNLRPHMAESWEISDDAKVWTVHLREGMRWSDGTPFTTADFVWWYENELKNTTLNPSPPAEWTTGPNRTMLVLEAVDDYTVKYTFADPNPLFRVTRPTPPPYTPGWYMEQWHMDLTTDKEGLEAKVKEAGFDSWNAYYMDNRRLFHLNPERPSVGPWIPKNTMTEELFIMERNPYFFAVDKDGNQLPYVDRITFRLFDSPEVLTLWVTNGEIDFQARHMSVANFTLYKENEDSGDYQVYVGVSANHLALQPNHTTKNERLREFFQNRDVRIALSIAVDRDTLNELIFDGLATPRQYSPISSSPQYYDKLTNAHLEYDPKQANALLDGAGYTEKDADGFRLWKDGSGETLSFTIEGTAQPGTADEDAVQQVIKYFADVGVKAAYRGVERSLYEEHYRANDIEAAWWGGDRTVLPLVAPIIWIGTQPDRPWAVAWGFWRTDPTNPAAEEPPADHWIRTIWDLWDRCAQEPDPNAQNALFFQILDIWADELPMIGYLGELPQPIIVKNGVRNYIEGLPVDDPTGDEHLYNTETYFWEDPENHA
jgi:peptide/nickel transport system substrate-binding protein